MVGGEVVEREPIVEGVLEESVALDTDVVLLDEVGRAGLDELDEALIPRLLSPICHQAVSPEI